MDVLARSENGAVRAGSVGSNVPHSSNGALLDTERPALDTEQPASVWSHDGQIVVVTLQRFDGWTNRLWAFSQMGLAKAALARIPGMSFFKVMGTGGGTGFSTVPNWGVVTILSVWSSGEAAIEGLAAPVFAERNRRASETAHIVLACTSSRGRWSRQEAFEPCATLRDGEPVAALTRATVKPRALMRFWRRVPAIATAIDRESESLFSIGMGEVPYLHQVTFSVWGDGEAMRRFSRESATHGEAVRCVAEEGWFSEQLFARFRPLGASGTWEGRPASERVGLPSRNAAQPA